MDSSHTLETLYAWFEAPTSLDARWLTDPSVITETKSQNKTMATTVRRLLRSVLPRTTNCIGTIPVDPMSPRERGLPYTVVMMMYSMLRTNNTLLFVAIDRDDKEVVDKCIEKKIDVNLRDTHGRTPLMYALDMYKPNTTGIIASLIAAGCNVNLTSEVDGKPQSPLMYAVKNGIPKWVKLLTDGGANPDVVEPYYIMFQERSGDKKPIEHQAIGTPLDCALKQWFIVKRDSCKEIVPALLAAGADVNLKSETQSPLALAVQWGNEEAMQLLLAAGARADSGGNERSDSDMSEFRNITLNDYFWYTRWTRAPSVELPPVGFDTPLGLAMKLWQESQDDVYRRMILSLLNQGADPRRTQFPVMTVFRPPGNAAGIKLRHV